MACTIDCEVLTSEGWKTISDIKKSDIVLQLNSSQKLVFSKIKSSKKLFSKDVFEFDSKYFNVVIPGNSKFYYNKKLVKPQDLENIKMLDKYIIEYSGVQNKDIDISDDYLRYIVWVVGDGTLIGSKKESKRVQFKLSRPEKIKKLEALLKKLNIEYTKSKSKKSGENKKQPYYIRISGDFGKKVFDFLDGKKEYPIQFRQCSKKQVDIIIDELQYVDGSTIDNGVLLTTSVTDDIDKIQELCAMHAIPNYCSSHAQGKEALGDKTSYKLYMETKTVGKDNEITITKKSHNDYVYCVDIVEKALIIRNEGKIGVIF